MKHYPSFQQIVFALALTAILISFYGVSQKKESNRDSFRKKSIKDGDSSSSSERVRDRSDTYLYEIEEQMKQLQQQMKRLEKQLQSVNMTKYQNDMKKMETIDLEEVTEEMNRKMEEIDWERINTEISGKDIEISRSQLQEVDKKIEQAKAALLDQKLNFQIDAKKFDADIKNFMEGFQHSIDNIKNEIKNVKEFTERLEKGGLIEKSKAYEIEVREGNLYINGKKQSEEISNKYKQFYRKSDFSIHMSARDEFRI